MSRRTYVVVAALTLALAGSTAAVVQAAEDAPRRSPAPGGPGGKTVWPEADKSGFGTAATRRSNVWFTLQEGRTSEVFYPDLSTPSVRNLELIVTDGRTFTDRESTDTRHRVSRPDARSLGFTQVNTARSGKYRITKRVVTDPARDAMRVRVTLTSLDGRRYQLFVLHDPALDNDGSDDSARTTGSTLVADDGAVATALRSRPAFSATSNGFSGENDGWTDLEGRPPPRRAPRQRRSRQRRADRSRRRRDRTARPPGRHAHPRLRADGRRRAEHGVRRRRRPASGARRRTTTAAGTRTSGR